jgi:hypothetical protein
MKNTGKLMGMKILLEKNMRGKNTLCIAINMRYGSSLCLE